MTMEQFKSIISERFPSLQGEYSVKNERLYFRTFRFLSGHRCSEYSFIVTPSDRWHISTPFGGCSRYSLDSALDAVKQDYNITFS